MTNQIQLQVFTKISRPSCGMEECPIFEVEDPFSFFMILLDCLTLACLLFNTYLIYCIVYRSTNQMRIYRWYLLWHQCVATFTDFSVNFLSKPILFMPFQSGYCAGIVRFFVPTSVMAAFILGLLGFNLATTMHLFCYRYLTITGRDSYPWFYIFRIGFAYSWSIAIGIQEFRAHIDDKIVIDSLKNEYSCVGDYLLKIPGFLIFDQDTVYRETAAVQIIFVGLFLFETSYCTYFSFRATKLAVMSPQLAQMHRKFLIQLIVQTLVPFGVLCVPMIAMVLIMRFKYYNLAFIGRITIVSFGSFSVIGGLTLIVMNRTYQTPGRKWLRKVFRRPEPDQNRLIQVQQSQTQTSSSGV